MVPITFAIFRLWLAPMQVQDAGVGAKATLQVGSDLWLKLRVVDVADMSTSSITITGASVRLWCETDF